MDNLKSLLEKRNSEKAAAEKIYKTAKAAKRSLKDDEAVKMTKHYRSAKTMNDNIKALKAKRSADLEAGKKVKSTRGDKKMNKKEVRSKETRALGHYLRGDHGKALRDINPNYNTSSMGVTIPETINNNVIQKLTEDAPVFNAVRHLPSTTGNLSILKESDADEAGFVGEGANVNAAVDSNLSKVTLNQKRIGAFAQLTNDILQDSAINLVNYTLGRLTWGFSKTIERAILLGKDKSGNKTFSPIVGNKDIKNVNVHGDLTVDTMLDIYDSINPAYLQNAMFVVSRPVFDQMVKLRDGNNQYLIFRESVTADKPGGFSFRGIPVYVSDTLNDAPTQIIMGDFNAGYGLMVKKGMNVTQVVADTTQALAGGRLIVLSAYMDGAVINPDAFVTASVGK